MIELLIAILPTLAPAVVGAVASTIKGHPDTTDEQRAAVDAAFARADAADAAFDALAPKPRGGPTGEVA